MESHNLLLVLSRPSSSIRSAAQMEGTVDEWIDE